mmetsp:Transcript_36893/g.119055  ORF Transcript_36893/g.119055 Transcript_36893/m.119055 type:complete len:352 (-) Transcript_36893:825-1880(-)
MQVVERAVDHLVIIERGRHVQRAVCHEHLPVELAQPLSHPVAQAVVGGDAERCSRLRAAGALAFDVAQVADSGAHPFGRLRDVPDVGLVDDPDDSLEEGRADDLVAHDERDDAGCKVGAPREVRRDRLCEAERDAGLSEKGHPVAVVVLGGLTAQLAAQAGAGDDRERTGAKEEDAGGAVAPQHAQVHRDAREGEEEEVDGARQVCDRSVEQARLSDRREVGRDEAGHHANHQRVEPRRAAGHLVVLLAEKEGEAGEQKGGALRKGDQRAGEERERREGGGSSAPAVGQARVHDERIGEAEERAGDDREEGLLEEGEEEHGAGRGAAPALAGLGVSCGSEGVDDELCEGEQ